MTRAEFWKLKINCHSSEMGRHFSDINCKEIITSGDCFRLKNAWGREESKTFEKRNVQWTLILSTPATPPRCNVPSVVVRHLLGSTRERADSSWASVSSTIRKRTCCCHWYRRLVAIENDSTSQTLQFSRIMCKIKALLPQMNFYALPLSHIVVQKWGCKRWTKWKTAWCEDL